MVSEQAKEAAVATAKESTGTPTGGNDATLQAVPTAGAVSWSTEAGGSGTLSDLSKTGDGRQEPPKLPLFSLSKDKRTATALDDAAASEPKRRRTEPSAQGIGQLGPNGDAGPSVGKPTLSQALDIRTFAKGVEKDINKMAKVAIEDALPGDKVLNDVVVAAHNW
jgi:hypothetical protein